MNKQHLSEALADKAGLSNREAWRLTTLFLGIIREELLSGRSVHLHRIGVLERARHQERNTRNPRTGETITTPARDMLRLRNTRTMLDALNGEADADG